MNIHKVLIIISGIQTLITSLILFFYKSKKRKINRYLGLFCLVISFQVLSYLLNNIIKHPAVTYFPLNFYLLDIVFIYLYAAETTGIKIKNKLKYYIPSIIKLCIYLTLFVTLLINPEFYSVLSKTSFDIILSDISSIYIIFISILIINVIEKHKKQLPLYYENIKFKKLNWLTLFCVILIIYNTSIYLENTFYESNTSFMYVNIIFPFMAMHYITISSLVQINIINITDETTRKKICRDSYNEIDLQALFLIIEKHMKENKIFLNPSITLKTFAKSINIPERAISKTINKVGLTNFNNYINNYRVEEFKELLKKEKYQKYSITALANEVGFNSRTSFYKNFKDIVGISPSDYAKQIKPYHVSNHVS